MENLSRRLHYPPSEPEKLSTLIRNFNPFYNTRLVLVNIQTVDQLVRVDRRLEARKSLIESYQPSNRRKTNLEPDLVYIETAMCNNVLDDRDAQSRTSEPKKVTCWNYRKVGHITKNYRNKREIKF